jgi:hypothetical protein
MQSRSPTHEFSSDKSTNIWKCTIFVKHVVNKGCVMTSGGKLKISASSQVLDMGHRVVLATLTSHNQTNEKLVLRRVFSLI